MRIYLAGPMRGKPEFNFPAFYKAAKVLEYSGHIVFNPAKRDNELHGTDISKGNMNGDEELAKRDHGFDRRAALCHSLTWICQHAEGIAMLPGWEDSRGAVAELATAEAIGLEVIYLEETK